MKGKIPTKSIRILFFLIMHQILLVLLFLNWTQDLNHKFRPVSQNDLFNRHLRFDISIFREFAILQKCLQILNFFKLFVNKIYHINVYYKSNTLVFFKQNQGILQILRSNDYSGTFLVRTLGTEKERTLYPGT